MYKYIWKRTLTSAMQVQLHFTTIELLYWRRYYCRITIAQHAVFNNILTNQICSINRLQHLRTGACQFSFAEELSLQRLLVCLVAA